MYCKPSRLRRFLGGQSAFMVSWAGILFPKYIMVFFRSIVFLFPEKMFIHFLSRASPFYNLSLVDWYWWEYSTCVWALPFARSRWPFESRLLFQHVQSHIKGVGHITSSLQWFPSNLSSTSRLVLGWQTFPRHYFSLALFPLPCEVGGDCLDPIVVTW